MHHVACSTTLLMCGVCAFSTWLNPHLLPARCCVPACLPATACQDDDAEQPKSKEEEAVEAALKRVATSEQRAKEAGWGGGGAFYWPT